VAVIRSRPSRTRSPKASRGNAPISGTVQSAGLAGQASRPKARSSQWLQSVKRLGSPQGGNASLTLRSHGRAFNKNPVDSTCTRRSFQPVCRLLLSFYLSARSRRCISILDCGDPFPIRLANNVPPFLSVSGSSATATLAAPRAPALLNRKSWSAKGSSRSGPLGIRNLFRCGRLATACLSDLRLNEAGITEGF
jgi:hypothetical protein